jgi:hypothetical protein
VRALHQDDLTRTEDVQEGTESEKGMTAELHNATIEGLITVILEQLPPEATRDMVIELLREQETEQAELVE